MIQKKDLLKEIEAVNLTLARAKALKNKIQDKNAADAMGYLYTSTEQLSSTLRKIIENSP